MSKINHETEFIYESFGLTKERFDSLIDRINDLPNKIESPSRSVAYEAVIKECREEFLGDGAEVSPYEMGLATVMNDFGHTMVHTMYVEKTRAALKLINSLAGTGASPERLFTVAVGILAKIAEINLETGEEES